MREVVEVGTGKDSEKSNLEIRDESDIITRDKESLKTADVSFVTNLVR